MTMKSCEDKKDAVRDFLAVFFSKKGRDMHHGNMLDIVPGNMDTRQGWYTPTARDGRTGEAAQAQIG